MRCRRVYLRLKERSCVGVLLQLPPLDRRMTQLCGPPQLALYQLLGEVGPYTGYWVMVLLAENHSRYVWPCVSVTFVGSVAYFHTG